MEFLCEVCGQWLVKSDHFMSMLFIVMVDMLPDMVVTLLDRPIEQAT